MLTSLGLVGKVIEFLVTTVSKKKLDLALDDRKRAAKAFIRLHEALLELETISVAFISYVEGLKNGKNSKLYKVHIDRRFLATLKPSAKEFFDSLRELTPTLSLYGPELSELLGAVRVGKMGVLKNFYYIVHNAIAEEVGEYTRPQEEDKTSKAPKHSERLLLFEPTPVSGAYYSLDLTIPNDTLMSADLKKLSTPTCRVEEIFGLMTFAADGSLSRGGSDVTDLFELVRDNLDAVHVDYLDVNQLIDLYPRLKRHHEVLVEARESLRQFIQARFALSDVLYVMKRHSDG